MFSNYCKKIDISNPTVLAGGANSWLGVGHDQAGPGRPRLARPVVYSNHGPKPDPACEIPISPTVSQARFAGFHLSIGVCPAWPVTSSSHFRVKLCFRAEVPPPRPFEATICSLARTQRCLWVAARCPQAAYEAESAILLYRPSDSVGARGLGSALIRRIWRYDKCHESWFCFFRGKKLKSIKICRHESWFLLSWYTT